jgi:hypothetical protein
MGETPPNYVKSYCHNCSGGVEFDANSLSPDNCVIPCPHCGKQMVLHVPKVASDSPAKKAIQASTPGEKAQRITLTKAQRSSFVGQALINLLAAISDDGLITLQEVRQLDGWLTNNADTEIPAFYFLGRLAKDILADGKVTTEEAYELQLAIERVVPKEIRDDLKEKRRTAYYNSPASQNQIEYLQNLGVNTFNSSLLGRFRPDGAWGFNGT